MSSKLPYFVSRGKVLATVKCYDRCGIFAAYRNGPEAIMCLDDCRNIILKGVSRTVKKSDNDSVKGDVWEDPV